MESNYIEQEIGIDIYFYVVQYKMIVFLERLI